MRCPTAESVASTCAMIVPCSQSTLVVEAVEIHHLGVEVVG